jgi:hypothetical protein
MHCAHSSRRTSPSSRRPGLKAALLCLVVLLAACSRFQHPTSSSAGSGGAAQAAIGDGDRPTLQVGRLAILTPTADPAHEEDRQTVASAFTKTLTELRPELAPIPLAKTLSSINAAGLADAYGRMYANYKETGLFDATLLRKIGPAVGVRYFAQLKLAAYDQSASGGMFSFMGLSLGRQQTADVRLYLEIWDSVDGTIVWEKSDEKSEKKRSLILTRTVNMDDVVDAVAKDLVKQLPQG